MPYKAAKAVAATFCYNIRHALTPIFGKEFLSMCILPKDPGYAKFQIDPAIVEECTIEANRWRLESEEVQTPASERQTPSSTPKTNFSCSPWGSKGHKQHRRQKTVDVESGYGTDTDQSDKYLFSPQVSPKTNTWTSINRPRSPTQDDAHHEFSPPTTPWLATLGSCYGEDQSRSKRTLSKVAENSEDAGSPDMSGAEGGDSESEVAESYHTEKDFDAAKAILQLSAADSALHRTKRTRRGSKY